jgi:uncharacterized protein (DUF1800 family)
VRKLWSYFVAGTPDDATAHGLERLYLSSGHTVRPVLTAILKHPALYEGGRLTKSPAVYTAGLLRRIGRGIDTTAWTWLDGMAGQQLFYPPNVAGWDDSRWLDTATWRGRWWIAQYVLRPYALDPAKEAQPYDAHALVDNALAFWNHPALAVSTRAALVGFAQGSLDDARSASWKKKQYAVMAQNALRHLIAVSPDFQTA